MVNYQLVFCDILFLLTKGAVPQSFFLIKAQESLDLNTVVNNPLLSYVSRLQEKQETEQKRRLDENRRIGLTIYFLRSIKPVLILLFIAGISHPKVG